MHKSPSTSCVDGDFRYFFCNSSLLLDKALLSYWWLMYRLCTFIQHFCNQPAIFAEPFEFRAHRGGHSPVPILETEQLAQGSLGFICSSLLCVLQFLLGGGGNGCTVVPDSVSPMPSASAKRQGPGAKINFRVHSDQKHTNTEL